MPNENEVPLSPEVIAFEGKLRAALQEFAGRPPRAMESAQAVDILITWACRIAVALGAPLEALVSVIAEEYSNQQAGRVKAQAKAPEPGEPVAS